MRIRKLVVVLLVVVSCLFTLSACTPSANKGKTLTVATPYSISTLNPLKSSADGDGYVFRQVMESLVGGEYTDLQPMLAESYTNPDDLTWEFKLRQNAYWHDGNAVYKEGEKVQVKAADVKACFDYALDPVNGAQYQAVFAQAIDKVEVVDDFTVRITTKQPDAWFLTYVYKIPIFSMKALEVLGQDGFDWTPIGTGPFKFVQYDPDDKVILERNEDYYIKPNLDKVVFRIIPDQNVATVALKTGEVDVVLQIPSTEVASVRAEKGLKTISTSRGGTYRYVALNCGSKFFKDKKVRDAMTMAIDMDSAAKAIFGEPELGLGKRAYCSVVPGVPGYNDQSDLWKFDPEAAKAALASLGWKPGSDGILTKNGVKFSFTLKTPSDAARSKLGIIVATDLKNIGIDCKPQALEWATLISDMNSGNYDMGISGGYTGEDGLFQMFHSTKGGGPELNYANPEVDRLLLQAKVTVNREERNEILIQAARKIASDRAHMPAYLEFFQAGVKEKILDFELPNVSAPLTSRYRNVDIAK